MVRRDRIEVVLGVFFVAILLAWGPLVSGGPKLSNDEVTGFVTRFDMGLEMPGPVRSKFPGHGPDGYLRARAPYQFGM